MTVFKCINKNIFVTRKILKSINAWKKTRSKLAAIFNHIKFLKRCVKEGIIPKGFKRYVGVPVRSESAVKSKIGNLLMNECISEHYRKQACLLKEESKLKIYIAFSLHPKDWEAIDQKITEVEKSTFFTYKERHLKKFEILCANTTGKKEQKITEEKKDTIVNLSKRTLTVCERSLLNKGLKFIPSNKKGDLLEFSAQVEHTMHKANLTDNTLPTLLKKELEKNIKDLNNLSKGEQKALKELKNDDSIVIMQSDKGGLTVILDKEDYEQKLEEHIQSPIYFKLKTDPTGKIDREIRKIATSIKKRKNQPANILHKIIGHETRHPSIFGSVKVHKEGFPMRPILSNFSTVTENAGTFCKSILEDYVKNRDNDTIIKNIVDLKIKISGLNLNESNIILTSLDVTNMYGSIEIDQAFKVISDIINNDSDFVSKYNLSKKDFLGLVKIILNNSYFTHKGDFFLQVKGLPMGSSLSGVAADLVMQNVEKQIEKLNLFSSVLRYYRYRDDYFLIWKGSVEELDLFHQEINQLDSNIKFTIEKEENSSLPYLDALISKNGYNINFETYSKPFASNLTLNYKAFHDSKVKNSIILSETNRILSISDFKQKDLVKLKTKLKQNDFPENLVEKGIKTASNNFEKKKNSLSKEGTNKPKIPQILKLKFQGRKSYRIKKIAKKFNLRAVFQKPNNLANIFASKYKTNTNCEKGVVYQVNCKCGEFYIGETGGDISKRMREHSLSIKRLDLKNGLAFHSTVCNKGFLWNQIKILGRERHYYLRKLKESLLIQKWKPKINLKEGITLAGNWE